MVKSSEASKRKTAATSRPRTSRRSSLPRQHHSGNTTTTVQNPKDQQILLNIFSSAFTDVLTSDRFPTLLQEIKQALFNRDFAAAFGNTDYLKAYAARWSPTRALCYATIFLDLDEHLGRGPAVEATEPEALKMLCIGGCAAEHVAFASYLQHTGRRGALTLLDSAPWGGIASLLQAQITDLPPLSKYASEAVRAANRPLLTQGQLECTFVQGDVLQQTDKRLRELAGEKALMVTLMFTLNELYAEGGIAATTEFLGLLGRILPMGSLLLVVDSPGSYSETAVGKERKQYPMQWLLNHTLTEGEWTECSWERLDSRDSVWFRLPEGLSYPFPLENMRYQMHLFRVRSSGE